MVTQQARNIVVAVGLFSLVAIATFFNVRHANELSREKQALTAMPFAAWIVDDQYRYIWANQAAFKMFHMTEDKFVGKTIRDVYKDEYSKQIEDIHDVILATRQPMTVKQRLIDMDGKEVVLIISRYPVRLNGHYGVAGVATPYVEAQRLPEINLPIDVGAIE